MTARQGSRLSQHLAHRIDANSSFSPCSSSSSTSSFFSASAVPPPPPLTRRTSQSLLPSAMDVDSLSNSSSHSSSKSRSAFSAVSSFLSNWLYATFGPLDSFVLMSIIVIFGLAQFAWWLFVFVRMMNEYLQGIVDPTSREWLRALGATVPVVTNTTTVAPGAGAAEAGLAEHEWRESIDVWFAITSVTAWDAFTIVINFNRSLLHQWHYYVSLRMMSTSFLVGYLWMYPTFQSLLLMIVSYVVLYQATEWLHQFLPVRGVRIGQGSPAEFSNHMSLFEVPWANAIFYAAVNGGFGLCLVRFVPRTFAFMNPVFHITWEVCFLGWMKTRQTARYIIFATPIVQAATAFDWGITQCMVTPRMYLHPAKFIPIVLLGRFFLDCHLKFLGRADFHWAREHCFTPTRWLIAFFAVAYVLDVNDILPILSVYYKFVLILSLHAFGVLVFLIPAAWVLTKPRSMINAALNDPEPKTRRSSSAPRLSLSQHNAAKADPLSPKNRLSISKKLD